MKLNGNGSGEGGSFNNRIINSYNNERDAFIDEIKRLEMELVERDKACVSYKEQLFELQQVIFIQKKIISNFHLSFNSRKFANI